MRNFSKKGGITIFLTSILITMIMASMVFVHAARSICGASYTDAVLQLAGRSVLSEFDRRLKDEYGIFAFYGTVGMVAQRIYFYASASFNKEIPGEISINPGFITDLFRLELEEINVCLASYSLMDVDVFEQQIESYMNFMIAQRGIEFIRNLWSRGTAVGEREADQGGQSPERELRNNAEILSLPSQGQAPGGINIAQIVAGGIPSMDTILSEGTLNFKVNEYILSHFKYNVNGDKDRETFFRNEVEYILYGRMSDRENLSRFRSDFILLRTPLNSAHILSSPQKRGAAQALAYPFGAFAPAAFVAIVAAWSLAEAENDARLLMAGKNVALIKTDSTWALGLENAVRVVVEDDDNGYMTGVNAFPRQVSGYVSPRSDVGLSYSDYLRLFLYLQRRETKLLRVMDLIQINLRGSYYEDFLIKSHYTGFSLSAVVSGKKFEYEQKY